MRGRVLLVHGGGGEETHELIHKLFLRHLNNPVLSELGDSALLSLPSTRVAYTTDAFTVSPVFFRGGDLGKLAVAGTTNDLACAGAEPLYLTLSFVIEEGFELEKLERIVVSIAEELKKNGALLAAGDTKVVPRGQADGLYLGASGIGRVVYEGLSPKKLKPGDALVVTGTVGDHGACILAEREGLEIELESDCRSLWPMLKKVYEAGFTLRAVRDATRGGLAGVLHEWARASRKDLVVYEEELPVKEAVRGLCELLGFEPYHLANEGMAVIAVAPEEAEKLVELLRSTPEGRHATIVGKVEEGEGRVLLENAYGVKRLMEPPAGELLPRIC
ncbi:MAG: hydrogenase expression/formation protein HypE [Aquificae bacterium]|nr:hydrogenase expression/formation protein HypE [Aquificota bacterium]